MKKAYFIFLIIFYLSIPSAFYAENVAFFLMGYEYDIIFSNYHNEEMVIKYYGAWKESSPLITFITMLSLAIWVVTLIFSVAVIRNGNISIPYFVDKITLVVSSIFTLLAIFLAVVSIPAGLVL